MEPALRIEHVSKRFGSTHALKNISLEVAPGEVLALCGENGAGKSTLMRILSGALPLDDGILELDGRIYTPRNPQEARLRGLSMVYQELSLAPDLTVEENILLGLEPHKYGWISAREVRHRARKALAELGHEGIDTKRVLRTLSNAERQLVEIARALLTKPKVLILDEPTSSLASHDATRLLEIVRRLAASGVSVIYISHFLEECERVADRYAVLRDGELVGTGPTKGTSLSDIVRLMVGREIGELYPRRAHTGGEVAFRADNLVSSKLQGLRFALHKGEILGIAGLMGSGRTEAVRACFGLDRFESGRVVVYSNETKRPSAHRSLNLSVGLLSENRKDEGLMLDRSIADNLTLSSMARHARFGWIRDSHQLSTTEKWIYELKIKAASPSQKIGELSGGNQQKVALARLLNHPCEILLLDEPTRGIDVFSKTQIYECIQKLAERGSSVLFVSSYIPELLGVCTRIAVMNRGTITETRPTSDWTEVEILQAALPKESEDEIKP